MEVKEEFRNLIPPLSEAELRELEQSILAEGCRDPLMVWNGTIVDGHHRYDICTKHNIPFDTREIEFESEDAAKLWIIGNQLARRNLPEWARFELVEKRKAILLAEGKETQGTRTDIVSKIDRKLEPHSTQKELAAELGWSTGKVGQAEVVQKKAPEELKEALRRGEKTIHQAYRQVKEGQRHDRERKSPVLTEQYNGPEIRRGDFREVLADLANGSVDVIMTDPPYGKESLPIWGDLGDFAARVLSPRGILIAYSGQLYLPEVIAALSQRLEWWWMCAVAHASSGNLTPLSHPVRKVINQFKPLLLFIPRGGTGFPGVFHDLISGKGADKSHHNWQQPVAEAEDILRIFGSPGGLVVDPFAGSGSFGIASANVGMRFIGAEVLCVDG